jgi:transposase InsO family protein
MKNTTVFPVEKMCNLLQVSSSSYYYWVKFPISNTRKKQLILIAEIRRIYFKSNRTYGSPRITKQLNIEGWIVSQKTVAKLMQEQHLYSILKRKFRVTTDSNHKYPVAPNLLKRKFDVKETGTVWVSDITYIKTSKGWLYLTMVMDLADRKIIGWVLNYENTGNHNSCLK